MPKEDLVKTIEAEIQKSDCYLFRPFLKELVKEEPKNHPLINTINMLMNETWQTVTEQKLTLDPRYSKKMKILTIMSCFSGCTTYSLTRLSREIQSSPQDTLDLLLEASISKLFTVKIDETKGLIYIVNSKVRERQAENSSSHYLNGKLTQTKEKNAILQKKIASLKKEVGGASKKEETSEITFGSGRIKW